MANNKKTSKPEILEKISQQIITDTLEINYMPYAMSVIVSRAIPEIDGFKPSHRKLLYTMYKMGLLNGNRTKSSNVVGQTMKLNPHGDITIYETMVRLTEGNGSLLHPFVDSKGNFGKQYSRDMAYAAPRYTEVKLSSICSELFTDIDKNTVEFVDNYDSTIKEPLLLPTTFPNIIVNPNQGIAVGMASSICSFNLKEVCDTTIAYINNPDIDILDTLKAPDFPGGGRLLYNRSELEQIYSTGRGNFRVYAKYKFDLKNNCIEITEIPYSTNVESIIDKVIQLIKTGKIKEITDIRDETDLGGLKIAIDVRRSTNIDVLMHKLFQQTPLSDTFSCNFNILIDGHPKTMGISEILENWVNFRIRAIKGQINYDIEKKSAKLHLLNGLKKILADIDKAISIIRHTELESMVVPNLMSGFKIDEKQAEYIAEIKLRNINKEYILNRIKETDELEKELKELNETLKSERKIKTIICNQLKTVSKKYGVKRRTEIITSNEFKEIPQENFIDDYSLKIFLTEQNYFKKISAVSLRTAGEQKLKNDDHIMIEQESTNRAELIFFSDKFNAYKIKLSDMQDTKASSLGDYLPNIIDMEENEKIIFVTSTTDYSGFIFMAFKNGKAVKIPLEAYKTKTNRKKLLNAYSPKSQLIFMTFIYNDRDFIIKRDNDKLCLFNSSLIPVSNTKTSGGVQLYTLKKNSSITSICPSDEFKSNNIEAYRINKIPSTGHFILEDDKQI